MQPKRYVRKESNLRKPIGRCGHCNGIVSIPQSAMSVTRPQAMCEDCGAIADEGASLPVVPMKKKD